MEIRALRPVDDRSAFDSGDEALDRYFRRYAGQNQFRHHLGVTHVAVEDGQVLGYATVAPGQIDVESLPAAARRRLPHYPLPILRLARLAVDRSVRSRGVGRQLLRYVCGLAVKMSEDVGCVGLVVDALPEAVSYYAEHGFMAFDTLEGRSEAQPRPVALFLALRAIKAALRAGT